jgi:hypothetical protein
MNHWKGFRRKHWWPKRGTSRKLPGRSGENHENLREFGVSGKIPVTLRPDPELERYFWTSLFGTPDVLRNVPHRISGGGLWSLVSSANFTTGL